MKPIKLDDIEKNTRPFEVPEGYFDDLPMKIQSRIETKKKTNWVRTPTFRLALSAATMFLIVLGVVFFNQSTTPEDMLADIPEEELLAYINMTELDEADILAAFQGSIESIEFEDSAFDDLNLEDESLDDLLLEYDLTDDYL